MTKFTLFAAAAAVFFSFTNAPTASHALSLASIEAVGGENGKIRSCISPLLQKNRKGYVVLVYIHGKSTPVKVSNMKKDEARAFYNKCKKHRNKRVDLGDLKKGTITVVESDESAPSLGLSLQTQL